MNLYWLQARFLNLDWTVRSDRKTLEPSTSTARLRWRTVPYEKSMNLYGPWFDCTILWTMIGSHGSNGCLVSSLKMASFHLFFFFFSLYGVVWSIRIEQNLTLKRWNPRLTLSITLWAFCLSLTLSLTSLVFASLPHCRRSSAQIAAQSISQVTLSITLYLSLTLISASLLRRRRSSLSASLLSLLLHRILA